jgi:hypothetical protein
MLGPEEPRAARSQTRDRGTVILIRENDPIFDQIY